MKPLQGKFSFFNEEEEAGFAEWRTWRDKAAAPIIYFLAGRGVLPEHLSILGILAAAPFIFFFRINPWISFFFLILNLLFDGLDGPLARAKGGGTKAGAFTDFVCDHFSFVVMFMTMFYYGMMNAFWATLYLLNYAVMISMVVYCRMLRIRFFPVVRSKYAVFVVFFIWLATSWNIYDPILVFFTVYMAVTNIFLFKRIRWALR